MSRLLVSIRHEALVLIALLLAAPAYAATVDRIAAVIDRQVLTVSEINQMAEIRFFPRVAGRSEDDYRHDILEALIAQALRFRDVERFGAQDIPKDSIEARLVEIQRRFASPAEFDAALARAELTPDELRALIKRQLQVEAYIQERFAPMVFVANEDIADVLQRSVAPAARRARTARAAAERSARRDPHADPLPPARSADRDVDDAVARAGERRRVRVAVNEAGTRVTDEERGTKG